MNAYYRAEQHPVLLQMQTAEGEKKGKEGGGSHTEGGSVTGNMFEERENSLVESKTVKCCLPTVFLDVSYLQKR